MTTAPRRPLRNNGGGKLGDQRAKAGVDAPDKGASGIHTLEPEEGELFEHDPADIGPNPMNRRLGLRNMDEMVASVQRQGVHTPGAVMHTKLFMEKYPEWADRVECPTRTYILGPGHRRHAAALEAGKPMLAILRDRWAKDLTVEENLISENNDRDNLTPIEQALQLDLLRQRGLTTEEIAERSNYGSKGTVTRYLNLLDLPQEIQDEVHDGGLSQKAAYTLSTVKCDQGKNNSPAAHTLQLKARGWMRDEGLSAEAAKNRLKQQTAARKQAKPTTDAPTDVSRGKRKTKTPETAPKPAAEADKASESGSPSTPSIPHQPDGSAPESSEADDEAREKAQEEARLLAAKESADLRDLACRLLIREDKPAGAGDLSSLLVNAVLNPPEWKPAAERARIWLSDLSRAPKVINATATAYFQHIAATGDEKFKRVAALAIALAANEVHAAQADRKWDARDRAHLAFLMTSKAAYEPTEYEQELLDMTAAAAK